MKELKTLPKWVVYLFFIIGIISAFSFRVMILVEDEFVARIFWYIAVIGYIFFFFYRYLIAKKRTRIIDQYHLCEKFEKDECLDRKSQKAALYIVASLHKSREKYNYYLIFLFSAIAIALDILLTLYK
jgi:hypothetical protein